MTRVEAIQEILTNAIFEYCDDDTLQATKQAIREYKMLIDDKTDFTLEYEMINSRCGLTLLDYFDNQTYTIGAA